MKTVEQLIESLDFPYVTITDENDIEITNGVSVEVTLSKGKPFVTFKADNDTILLSKELTDELLAKIESDRCIDVSETLYIRDEVAWCILTILESFLQEYKVITSVDLTFTDGSLVRQLTLSEIKNLIEYIERTTPVSKWKRAVGETVLDKVLDLVQNS